MCVIMALNLFSSRVNQSFWLNKKNFLDLQMEIWAGEEKKQILLEIVALKEINTI